MEMRLEVKAAIFASPFSKNSVYVVHDKNKHLDTLAFLEKYCSGSEQAKQADGVNLDDWDSKYWMCFVSDCFDPPVAIVCAADPCEAVERFVEECKYARCPEEDCGVVGYGPNGETYDEESMQCQEVTLLRVELA